MAHKRPSKHLRPSRPLLGGQPTTALKSTGRYIVRRITTDRALKTYTCPGCSREIAPGVAHIVAWPATPPIGSSSGSDYRRHWHTACWNRER